MRDKPKTLPSTEKCTELTDEQLEKVVGGIGLAPRQRDLFNPDDYSAHGLNPLERH